MKAIKIIRFNLITFIFLLISKSSFAYNGPEHHRHMGVRAADESNLDRYLKDNLGFSEGINTTLTNPDEAEGEQTKKIYEWIGYGGIMEDKGGFVSLGAWRPRVRYHFYDPVTNAGLTDGPRIGFAISSLEWGREQANNDYSWAKARENYYLALTSETKEERERYWALTFRSLGQVLHLIQDLASPAHVRNDNHMPYSDNNDDPYESIWGSTSPEGRSFIHAMLAHGALGNPDYQYPAVELDRFEDYWDSEDGRGLAEFTNSNFVSKDTNVDILTGPHHYDNPRPTGLYRDPELFEFTDSDGVRRRVNVTYYTSNVVDNYAPGRSVNPFNYLTAVSFWNFYTARYDPGRIHYTLNRKCHEEYAKILVPRTVGYGAGLLNYFFRGKLQVVDARLYSEANNGITFSIRNVGNEDLIGGTLSLYCPYALSRGVFEEGVINDLIVSRDSIDIPSGEEVTISYDFPISHVQAGGFVAYQDLVDNLRLIYKGGRLGSEMLEQNQASAAGIIYSRPPSYFMMATVDGRTGYISLNGSPYNYTEIQAGYRDSYYFQRAMYTLRDLPSSVNGNGQYRVRWAKLVFRVINGYYNVVTPNSFALYRVTGRDREPDGSPQQVSYDPVPIEVVPQLPINDWVWVEVDITDLVQGWIDGNYPNLGVVIKFVDENPLAMPDVDEWGMFAAFRNTFFCYTLDED